MRDRTTVDGLTSYAHAHIFMAGETLTRKGDPMNATTTNLRQTIEQYLPLFASTYTRFVENTFAALVERLGPDLRMRNAGRSDYAQRDAIRSFIRHEDITTAERIATGKIQGNAYLVAERVEKGAAEYAAATVEMLLAKIEAKLEDLDESEVIDIDGAARFTIRGKRAGRRVEIEQTRILNVSSRGLLFNQYPARIYVDGKFTSEAKYKALFA
jgi:hypothetical protein